MCRVRCPRTCLVVRLVGLVIVAGRVLLDSLLDHVDRPAQEVGVAHVGLVSPAWFGMGVVQVTSLAAGLAVANWLAVYRWRRPCVEGDNL